MDMRRLAEILEAQVPAHEMVALDHATDEPIRWADVVEALHGVLGPTIGSEELVDYELLSSEPMPDGRFGATVTIDEHGQTRVEHASPPYRPGGDYVTEVRFWRKPPPSPFAPMSAYEPGPVPGSLW